jgi:hypothetical protein
MCVFLGMILCLFIITYWTWGKEEVVVVEELCIILCIGASSEVKGKYVVEKRVLSF